MSKREVLEEILAKKQRGEHDGMRAVGGLDQLESSIERSPRDEATRSLQVVGIVACIEVAARDAICHLIDSGPPYADRVGELLRGELRFSIEVIRAFQDKKVSLGEFVTHLLPISNVAHIIGHLDVLLGGRFHQVLAAVREYAPPPDVAWYVPQDDADVEEATPPPPLLVTDVNSVIASIARAFAARHIAAHEANFSAVAELELREYLAAAKSFATALHEYVRQTLEPNVPRSAHGESVAAMIEAGEASQDMMTAYGGLLAELRGRSSEYGRSDAADLLQAAQVSFDKHLEDEISFNFALYSPVSGNAMRHIEARSTKALCTIRGEALKDALNTVVEWQELTKRYGA
ncbi:MAG: hypothetical protein AABO58_00165 [Acidobacteriota bacterium]